MEKNKKIAITTTSFGEYENKPLELLRKEGFEVILNPYRRKLKSSEIVELCKDAVGIIAGTEMIDAEILKRLTQSSALCPQSSLKVISRCGAGLDNVDHEAAKRLGIEVFNTPDAPTLAVAELTVGLILNLLRKVNLMDNAIRNGRWEKLIGNLLSGKRVGIIGFGRIGRKVSELVKSFNCEIAYADPFVDDDIFGLKRLSLEELLRWADIISIHVSGKDKLVKEKHLSLMKKGSWLINVARGGVVDENALYRALKKGSLSGAALDVFTEEPYNGCLKELDNVILTPHIGSYALEARIEMERQAVENLLKGLEGVQ